MKKISALLIALTLILSSLNFAYASDKEVNVKVKGIVCSFCVKNIEKSFLKNDSIEAVTANLDTKIVTINLKEGKNIKDEYINETITDAGFNVTEITR